MTLDQDSCVEFRARFVTDLGATMAAGNVVVGHRLGLYRALATEPGSPAQLAERSGTDPRYVAEWLAGQAAGGYVTSVLKVPRIEWPALVTSWTLPASTCCLKNV